MRQSLVTGLLVALALGAGPARARQEPQAPASEGNRSPYRIDWGLDLGLTAGGLVIFGLPSVFESQLAPPWCGLDCDRQSVNALDRTVIGKRSETARMLSDAGLITSCSLPVVLGAIDVLVSDPEDGWAGYGRDFMVLAETYALTLATTTLLKLAIGRPRPLVYDPERPADERLAADSAMSFPSGHTATTFALATAYSYTFTRRHPDSGWVAPVWIGTYALAGLTGVMRTEAGKHFWTDVIAGAALGVGIGLLVPWLHLHPEADEARPEEDDEAGLLVQFVPLAGPDGFGAALVVR